MTDRRGLLFVTRDLKVEARSGAPIRTQRLLAGLARAFDVTAITFEHADGSIHGRVGREELTHAFPGVRIVTVKGLGAHKRAAQLLSLTRPRSHEWGRYRSAAMRRAIDAEVAVRTPHIVHFDDPGVAQVGPIGDASSALAAHNIEHRILAETARAAAGPRAAYALLEAAKVAREERRLWREMDLCVAVSDLDARAMRAGGARRTIVCPNGTDPVDPLPPPRKAPSDPLRLLFVGTGTYWPNAHGLAWLMQVVLPLVRQNLEVSVDVVGTPPRAPVHAPDVTYHGQVPELRSFYARAHAVVVPLHQGSGTRLKVVEGMAYGRPVVSTALGAEGLPVRAGEHFLRADDAETFAAALMALAPRLNGPDEGVLSLLQRARAAVRQLFWPKIGERLADAYQSVAASHAPLGRDSSGLGGRRL